MRDLRLAGKIHTHHHSRRAVGRAVGLRIRAGKTTQRRRDVITVALGLGVLLTSNGAHAAPEAAGAEAASTGQRAAMGFQLDLFPTVVSAVNGKLGYAPQVWVGVQGARLRLVGAHLEPPDALAFGGEGFVHPTTTVFATIVDYTFGPRFDGFWLGTGFELWQQTIEHEREEGKAAWSTVLGTVGGGYIWRFSEHFYIDPGVGMHVAFNPATVTLGGSSYDAPRILGDAFVKFGVMTDL